MQTRVQPHTRPQPPAKSLRSENQPQASRPNPFHDMQQQELAHLRASLRNEFFFFIADWPSQQIRKTGGIERWLGYSEGSFSATDFARAEHPGQAKIRTAFSETFLRLLHAGRFGQSGFLSHQLVVQQALRHRDGSPQLFKHTLSPWQLDEKQRVTACLHEFHFLDDHHGEPLRPRLSFHENQLVKPFEIVRQLVSQEVQKAAPFTRRHWEILQLLAAEPQQTEKQLADKLFITAGTIHVHSRLMLPLARNFFHQNFETLKQLVGWMCDSGVLSRGEMGAISED